MLPHSFFDWWFAPWTYATQLPSLTLPAVDQFGQRDGYRLWCAHAGIGPDLPDRFDPAWSVAAADGETGLTAAARLFAGLIAARQHDQAVLDTLSPGDRKWCISIAATQPLLGWPHVRYGADDTTEMRGLVELACWLERDFPGMWPRLRLLLPAVVADQVGVLLRCPPGTGDKPNPSSLRAQRCWRLCSDRIVNVSAQPESKTTDDATDTGWQAEHLDAVPVP
jgi:hypothetical protein